MTLKEQHSIPLYGDVEYWDSRYIESEEKTFEWLQNWQDLKEIVEFHAIHGIYGGKGDFGQTLKAEESKVKKIRETCNVLITGCGNSCISENMYDDGYRKLTNNDISTVCIENMKKRNIEKRPEIKWEVMDIRDMAYEDSSFDLIIDKSTIDTLLCA